MVVVLGAHAEKIRPAIAALPVSIAENTAWPEGMASSLRAGFSALAPRLPQLDAVLIALCDQPHFSATAIRLLEKALSGSATIAATRHGDFAGVPAVFTRTHFADLAALHGEQGARALIAAHRATTATVEIPALSIDIDTPADLAHLRAPTP